MKMAALGSPARTLRGLLRELRYMNAATGRPYRDTAAYRYLVKAFRAHRVRKPVSGCSSGRSLRKEGGRGLPVRSCAEPNMSFISKLPPISASYAAFENM
ncbi:protein FMC1 homolog isoform X2 [Acinonyx jubatus]|uniref:Protein FMC1 homolog n=1 Tax=Acinonyx jubatus TaxID=32536 RepID=A0ABM3PQP5_ACIJB|nr:protein FMC1 homolog isoform X2 [Acinonyx jubatus]